MKLNLQIIKEELDLSNPKIHFIDPPTTLSIDYPIPYVAGSDFCEGTVCIAHAIDLPRAPATKGHPSLICIGDPPLTYLEAPFNTLAVQEDADAATLLKSVAEVFARYQSWGDDLLRAIAENRPLKEFATASLPFIDNPLCVVRPNFRILFHVMDADRKLTTAQYQAYCSDYGEADVPVPDGAFLKPDSINELIADPRYIDIINAVKPTISALGNDTFRTLFKNVRTADGTCFARILIDEVYHRFTDKDVALLEILDGYLEKRIHIQDPDDLGKPRGLDQLVNDLFSRRSYDEQALKSALAFYHWNAADTFLCMVLESKSFEQDTEKLEAFAAQMAPELSSDFFSVFEGRLVFVFNLTQMRLSKEELLRKALPLLRDRLFIVGFGASFIDFRNIRDYYLQAVDAMNLGKERDPFNWVFRYEKYQLECMLRRCRGDQSPESLIPEGLHALALYDREKGMDYLPFLRFYLEHALNIAETSKAFFLHRNTCVHRLRRIREISRLDLDDPNVRFQVELAFRIADLAG